MNKTERKEITLRKATMADVTILTDLIAESARGVGLQDYTNAQIEAAIGTAWMVDTDLIEDGTFWLAEVSGQIVGCGGWSRRKALAGSGKVNADYMLEPHCDAARIRAFFVHPDWVRQGIGTALLRKCETESQKAGFRSAELLATLPGEPLYATNGYRRGEPYEFPLGGGVFNTVVPMWKDYAK